MVWNNLECWVMVGNVGEWLGTVRNGQEWCGMTGDGVGWCGMM